VFLIQPTFFFFLDFEFPRRKEKAERIRDTEKHRESEPMLIKIVGPTFPPFPANNAQPSNNI